MPVIDPEVLLLHLVKLYNNLYEVQQKSRNKVITSLLEKECNHLLRIVETIELAFPIEKVKDP
jgi:hypothetical protein